MLQKSRYDEIGNRHAAGVQTTYKLCECVCVLRGVVVRSPS